MNEYDTVTETGDPMVAIIAEDDEDIAHPLARAMRREGFDVTVERRLEPVQGFDGPARTETVDTHYEPSDEVWCTNPASPEFSGSTVPPSWDYRPFSERKADKAQDARDRAEREARADQQAEQEAAEQDGRPEGGASPSPSSSPSGEPGAGPSPSAG